MTSMPQRPATVTGARRLARPKPRGSGARGSWVAPTVTLPELLVNGSDHAFREMIALLYASIGHLQSMRRRLADTLEVSTTELSILLALRHLSAEGPVRIKRIADHLRIAASNVTAAISALQDNGWVAKTADPADSRAVSIALTASANSRLTAFAGHCSALNDRWFAGLTRKDMLAVIAFLRRLDEHYDDAYAVACSMARTA